jgi:hypothetical protein
MRIWIACLYVLATVECGVASPFEVTSGNFQPPGESNPRPCKFIKLSSYLVLLPQRSSYLDVVHNAESTIWAVNYHETSNFDSVDLIVGYNERLFILPNIWSNLEERFKAERLLPNVPVDRCRLSVTSVQADTLSCTFRGFSKQLGEEITNGFEVTIKRGAQGVEFSVRSRRAE